MESVEGKSGERLSGPTQLATEGDVGEPKSPEPVRETVTLTPEQEKARKARNYMIAAGLLAFAALVFIVTMVRLGENVANRTF